MKVIALGSFETDECLNELRGRPILVLTGDLDELRAAGELPYQSVKVVAVDAPTPSGGPEHG